MEFLETNYIWIIVVGVIILMAIIGYFAEKSSNNKKEPKKVKNKKMKNDLIEPLVNENLNENILTNGGSVEDSLNNLESEETKMNLEEKGNDENSFEPFEGDSYSDIDEEVETEVELPVVKEEVLTGPEEIINDQNNFNIDDNMSDDFKDIEEDTDNLSYTYDKEANIDEEKHLENSVSEIEESDDLEMGLPSIDTLNEEIKDVEDEDDVWKF